MAFVRKNLQAISGGGSNAPQVFSYLSTDNKAATLAANYFDSALKVLAVGDFIMARCSDGALVMSVATNDGTHVTTITSALA